MLKAQNLTKQFAGQLLFDEASFVIGTDDKIGLVGRNGAGKTTLLKMIRGIETLDGGEISTPKNFTIGALDQHLNFTHPDIISEAMSGFRAEHGETILENETYRAEKILMGLGFKKSDFVRPPSEFSGGYQVRIQLAKTLLGNPSLLLLDEPTNYLDIVSINWLKKFLRSYEGSVVLVTHDRQFMDSVVTHIVGIHRKKIKKFPGNTIQFYQRIMEEEELYEKTRLNNESKKKELEAFITRFKAKASKASQARSRMKQLEKMEDYAELKDEATASFQFNFKDCPGKILCTVENLSFSYKPEMPLLFSGLNFPINARDRIGIIGKNGKGKSTLLNVLAGHFKANQGTIKFHPSALVGFYGQTNIQRLNLNNSIIEEIQQAGKDLTIQQVRNICGTVLFSGDRAQKKISVLSGGEKARVLFGKVMANPSNVLLLDEPTNHLDMQSIESLVEEVDAYPGALVVVTHNEQLLHAFAKKLIIFKKDNAELFLGSYQDFLDRGGWEKVEAEEEEQENSPKTPPNSKKSVSIEKKVLIAKDQKQKMEMIAVLEQKIFEHEEIIKKLELKLVDAYSANDLAKIKEFEPLGKKLKSNLEDLYRQYEELAAQ
jgi:ATP-binding cassette subfamily F protein 3